MSVWIQILSVLIFLSYSIGYLCFVAWASEKATGTPLHLGPKARFLLAGAVLPWLLLGVFLLATST